MAQVAAKAGSPTPFSWEGAHAGSLAIAAAATCARVLLVAWGGWQDEHAQVRYTDVDYDVFTDAAAHVVEGGSPYERATYRYTPVIAWLMVPNVLLHPSFGKILFCGADLGVGMLLREILVAQGQSAQTALKLACLWLLNPLAMNICSRGSSDAVLSTLLLGSLLLLEPARSRESISLQRVAAAGALFGLAVHLRVYPIIYAPSFVFHLAYQGGQAIGVAKWLQSCFSTPVLLFAVVSACVFLTISYMCFFLYGDAYLWNSLLYHVGRADNRHNFSMYFYWIYLGYERLAHSQVGLIMFVPQIALLLATSFKYAADLPTCIFLQTAIFVACNKVCTGQYFIWYLCLLPLVIPKLRMTLSQFTVLLALWVGALLHWLLWAYLLEFQGLNTFRQLWVAGAIFFAANIKVLCSIIDAYTGGQDKKRQHSS